MFKFKFHSTFHRDIQYYFQLKDLYKNQVLVQVLAQGQVQVHLKFSFNFNLKDLYKNQITITVQARIPGQGQVQVTAQVQVQVPSQGPFNVPAQYKSQLQSNCSPSIAGKYVEYFNGFGSAKLSLLIV